MPGHIRNDIERRGHGRIHCEKERGHKKQRQLFIPRRIFPIDFGPFIKNLLQIFLLLSHPDDSPHPYFTEILCVNNLFHRMFTLSLQNPFAYYMTASREKSIVFGFCYKNVRRRNPARRLPAYSYLSGLI